MKRLIPFIVALFLAFSAFASGITPQQAQTLKVVAQADQTANGFLISGNDTELREWFNAVSAKIVWRSSLQPEQMRAAIIDGAGQLDNLTVGKRDALLYLVSGELPNTTALRSTLDDLCGSQNTLKDSIVAAEKRVATRAEAAIATGTGTTQTPATLTWEGLIDFNDLTLIREQ
jgi:hypothetical protein